jgi:hypothetical protein
MPASMAGLSDSKLPGRDFAREQLGERGHNITSIGEVSSPCAVAACIYDMAAIMVCLYTLQKALQHAVCQGHTHSIFTSWELPNTSLDLVEAVHTCGNQHQGCLIVRVAK